MKLEYFLDLESTKMQNTKENFNLYVWSLLVQVIVSISKNLTIMEISNKEVDEWCVSLSVMFEIQFLSAITLITRLMVNNPACSVRDITRYKVLV